MFYSIVRMFLTPSLTPGIPSNTSEKGGILGNFLGKTPSHFELNPEQKLKRADIAGNRMN